MKLTRFALLLASLTASALAQQASPANHASEQEVRTLLDALHMQQLMASTMKNMSEGMVPMLEKTFADTASMNEEDRKFVVQSIRRNMEKIMGAEYIHQAIELAVPIYQENMSSEEVKAATAFFSSPAGQSWTSKSPVMQRQLLSKLQPVIAEKMDEMQQATQRDMREHMKEKSAPKQPPPSNHSSKS
jgi:hypothetical protein